MASSQLGDVTADAGRVELLSAPPPGYRFLLPAFPSGEGMKLCVVLHCDLAARPYRVEDFRSPLETLGLLKDVTGIGSYQMGHVWLVSVRTEEDKERLLAKGSLQVKGRFCAVVKPTKQEVTFKVHWVPFFMPNEALRRAFSEFGDIQEVRQEGWSSSTGFGKALSTTRVVRVTLSENTTPEALPHLFKVEGEPVLVVVPGRAPVCLRCRRSGHIRRDCRTPRCLQCHAFGHLRQDCVRSYASVAVKAANAEESTEEYMDAEEATKTAPTSDYEATRVQGGNHGDPSGESNKEKLPKAKAAVESTVTHQGEDPQPFKHDEEKSAENGTPADSAPPKELTEAPPKRRRNDGPTMSEADIERKLREAEKKWLVVGRGGRVLTQERRSSSSSPVRGSKPPK